MEPSKALPRTEHNPHRASKSVTDPTTTQTETELTNARKTVRNLAQKILESKSRSKATHQKRPQPEKLYEHKVSSNNKEDYRYTNVIKEVEHITRELRKLKLDMARVLNKKRHADHHQTELPSTLQNASLLQAITEELETANAELASIKTEGFDLAASMDVIRTELKHVREKTSRVEKEEERRELTVQTVNSKILKQKAVLESVTTVTEKASSVASNLSATVKKLTVQTEIKIKEKEIIVKEIDQINSEILKTGTGIELSGERLEAKFEEMKTAKLLESTAVEELKNVIDCTLREREMDSLTRSTITITEFEYEYFREMASVAERVADKKVAVAEAWVEALRAHEKEILMKEGMGREEIEEVSENEGVKALASPKKATYTCGNVTPGKRGRSKKLLSRGTRHAIRSASFRKKVEKVSRNLGKLVDEDNEIGEEFIEACI